MLMERQVQRSQMGAIFSAPTYFLPDFMSVFQKNTTFWKTVIGNENVYVNVLARVH